MCVVNQIGTFYPLLYLRMYSTEISGKSVYLLFVNYLSLVRNEIWKRTLKGRVISVAFLCNKKKGRNSGLFKLIVSNSLTIISNYN